MKKPVAVLSLLLVALAAPCLGQTPILLPEFQVNTAAAGYNYADGVAMDPDGGFIVTWSGGAADTDALGRLFDPQAAPIGGPFPASASTTGDQFLTSVSTDASGRFVVVWTQENTTVFGRRFDADGTPLAGDFQVNTSTPINATKPFVASDASGNFVVAWTSITVTGAEALARRFDSSGTPLGNEFPVNVFQAGTQLATDVAMSPAGFVVTWAGDGMGGPGIFGRLFDPSGSPLTGDFQANTDALTYAIRAPDVAMSKGGAFVVVWDDGETDTTIAAFGRRYDATGTPLGPVFPVHAATSGPSIPRVASDSAGNFLVAWSPNPLDGDGNAIAARFYDSAGTPVGPEFQVNAVTTGNQLFAHPAVADDGTFVVTWSSGSNYLYDVKGRKSGVRASPQIEMDPNVGLASSPTADIGNGVFEPGETVVVRTAWVNDSAGDVALSGTASSFTGPAGPDYTLNDGAASYGTIPATQSATCIDGGDCYSVTLSAPAVRPVQHWDTEFHEALNIGVPKTWQLHVGESFPDVATDNLFYRFIETLFHSGVTGGCAGGNYCPVNPVTRAQMAVFLLKAKFGSAHIPPPCTGTVFPDVPCTGGPFDPWIEELAGLAITGGCGGGAYCPNNTVTRQQMAVFLLKALEGSSYDPPDCTQIFADVSCTPGTGFSDWIEELYDRAITGGCSAVPLNYCPTNPNNRGQMAVFLTKTFGLVLY